jgi:ribosomal protein S18 acetylase RimI-like enzyme
MEKVNVKIRKGTNDDLDAIYECHKQCFEQSDQWYKTMIAQNLKSSYIIIIKDEIAGIMLQGDIKACDLPEVDDFIPLNEEGVIFKENNFHVENLYGITMLCILPKYRGKGLASKLLEIHFKENKDKSFLCLNTRKSNKAVELYLKMGYNNIAEIKNKYFFPNENSYFMIKK